MHLDGDGRESVGSTRSSGDIRAAVAGQLRGLAHELMARDPDPDALVDMAGVIAGLRERVATAPRRDRVRALAEALSAASHHDSPPFATANGPLADRPILGATNPFAVDARTWIEGQEAVTELTLGPAFEGAPGRAHGGIVAAIFDDITGHALAFAGRPAFTGSLTVRYNRPTPLGERLEFRARLDREDGRRLHISASCAAGGEVIAECEAIYITVDADRFAEALRT